jgi:hypothetical protein
MQHKKIIDVPAQPSTTKEIDDKTTFPLAAVP